MPSAEFRFDAIGAPWRIDTASPLSDALKTAIAERIDAFDRTWSRFRDDSLVTRISTQSGSWRFPPEAAALFALYRRLYEATAGAVSPLVGARLENLGYDRAYSLTPAAQGVSVPAWDDAVAWDGETLTCVRPVLLDVGAAGKGYLVDIVAEMLADDGITEYVVDASGDLVHRGDTPLRIALEDPRNPRKAIGVYTLQNAALAASASNRRAWGTNHHIIDGITGLPTSEVVATWTVASSGLDADGLATGLFFRGAAAFTPTFDFQYVRMFSRGTVEFSRDFQGEMFT